MKRLGGVAEYTQKSDDGEAIGSLFYAFDFHHGPWGVSLGRSQEGVELLVAPNPVEALEGFGIAKFATGFASPDDIPQIGGDNAPAVTAHAYSEDQGAALYIGGGQQGADAGAFFVG